MVKNIEEYGSFSKNIRYKIQTVNGIIELMKNEHGL